MGFIMYIAHMLQVHHLIENFVTYIERENGDPIETAIQYKVAFQNEEDRRDFYNTYNGKNESQRIVHNQRKVPNIYFAPKNRNLLAINLLRAFSLDPDQEYPTAGTQQRFVPDPGDCLAYQSYRNFSA